MSRPKIVTFTSDYGLEDEFVGVCRGVMLNIAADLKIVDVHHNVLRQDVRHGAVVLQQSIKYLPVATHLAVVDPGVGSTRKAVAVVSSSGSVFVGPDNGLLVPAAENGGTTIESAFEISNEKFLLSPISQTFQGRDVFAPAAAHIADGVDPADLGPPLDPADLVRLEIPDAWVHDDHLHGEVLQVDRFGNLQFNFDRSHLAEVGLAERARLEVRMEGHRIQVTLGSTFAEVDSGEFVLIEDSYGQVSLAVNKGDARARLRAGNGSTVIVGPPLGE
ncbi:MAG: SAM-dependent chlorinase/fluorinase [Actinomycetota bacterium]|nr:SAM-dependent chlorinase/fluorinase [Actinomycetota bacterium]